MTKDHLTTLKSASDFKGVDDTPTPESHLPTTNTTPVNIEQKGRPTGRELARIKGMNTPGFQANIGKGRPPMASNKVPKAARLKSQAHVEEGLDRLLELMRQNDNLKVALDATNALLNRGLGMAPRDLLQKITTEGGGTSITYNIKVGANASAPPLPGPTAIDGELADEDDQ